MPFVAALSNSVKRAAANDQAYAALLLYLPTVGELILDVKDADPSAIHEVRAHVRRAIATTLEGLLLDVLLKAEPQRSIRPPRRPDGARCGRRRYHCCRCLKIGTRSWCWAPSRRQRP